MIVRHRFPTVFDRDLDRSIDRAFEQLTSSFFDGRRSTGPTLDGQWHGDTYVLTVDLPGVPAEAVTVQVTGDTMSLEARTDRMHWQRTVRLGGSLDPDTVSAHHVDGRLTVRIGTLSAPEPRSVTISTTPPPVSIDRPVSDDRNGSDSEE